MNVSKVEVWKAEMFGDGKPHWIIDIYTEDGESPPIKIISEVKPVVTDKSE